MVQTVTTYYCEKCKMGYAKYEDALCCESSGEPKLRVGDVILRSARGGDGFTVETGAFVWGKVVQVRTVGGKKHAPFHSHFYRTTGVYKEIAEQQLENPVHGQLTFEKGIMEGPGYTKDLIYLMETYPDVRTQMAEAFALLSECAGLDDLDPESYAKWDDLRYTVYDFGVVAGDAPLQLSDDIQTLLQWCARCRSPERVHRTLFMHKQHGGNDEDLVYAPFDDTVGERSKWFVGRGDPYRYLRFHMQSRQDQLRELEGLVHAVYRETGAYADRLEWLFELAAEPSSTIPLTVKEWAEARGMEESGPNLARMLFDWLIHEQERWRVPVQMNPSIVPQDIPVFAVAAGKGGVGKSTFAAEFARAVARKGRRPLLLDLDFYGPSAPTEFGITEPLQIRNGYIQPHVKDDVRVVSIGNMIGSDTALQWRGPVLEAFIHLLTAHVSYNDIDVIVLDCPPGTGDVQMGIFHRIRPDAAVLLTTASELSLADVRRAVVSFQQEGIPIAGLIENMSEIAIGEGRFKRLFGAKDTVSTFCAEYAVPYLGNLPFVDTQTDLQLAVDAMAELLLHE